MLDIIYILIEYHSNKTHNGKEKTISICIRRSSAFQWSCGVFSDQNRHDISNALAESCSIKQVVPTIIFHDG